MKTPTPFLVLASFFLFNFAPILNHIQPTPPQTSHHIILTGGPGVGKSSIIHYLKEHGYHVVEEAATDVILHSLAAGIEKPWDKDHQSDFNDQILELQEVRNKEAPETTLVFFDRSMIDTFTYALIPMGGTKSLPSMATKLQSALDAKFYHKTVFFIDNLSVCANDRIRHENLTQLFLIEGHLEQNYQALGYDIVHIPPGTVEERAQQILSFLHDLYLP